MATFKKTASKQAGKQGSTEKRWNTDISGVMTVFGNEFKGKNGSIIKYSTTLSTKDEFSVSDSGYLNEFIKVSFAKDCDPRTTGRILVDIKKAFITLDAYENKDGEVITAVKVVVQDCTTNVIKGE